MPQPHHSDDFTGKVALVTGGAKGIGRAICLALAQRGAKVAVNYYSSKDEAKKTLQQIEDLGSTGTIIRADVSIQAEVVTMVEQVTQTFGPIEYLVNNAGIYHLVNHGQHTPEIWRRTLEVNLTGPYQVIWAVKDSMIARKFGRIVNMSSLSGLAARPWSIPYAVSKAGVIALTKSCAAAFARYNIRVNAVAPGLVETEMLHRSPDELVQKLIRETPMERVGTPEEIAKAVLFLLSEDSSFTTGQTLLVCGGRMMMP
ncbi:MAG: SDR family oxidoreductase [Verrucomicrobiales bacterium]|nr:SDR family oxidoreductase [Verrucomicrobiales bacterium]